MTDSFELDSSVDIRKDEIIKIIEEICSTLWLSEDIAGFFRVSQSDTETKKWDFFEWVHSEMGTGENDRRWYAIDFKSWKWVIISIEWDLRISWYSRISIKKIVSKSPKIWGLILRLKSIESEYREKRWLPESVADRIHRTLIDVE